MSTADVVIDGASEDVHCVRHDGGGMEEAPTGHGAVAGRLHDAPCLAVQVKTARPRGKKENYEVLTFLKTISNFLTKTILIVIVKFVV